LTFLRELSSSPPAARIGIFAAISMLFSIFGRLVRGVSGGGAIAGALVCFVLLWAAGTAGFLGLLAVFALTWISTRTGYARKQRLGTAEGRSGRNSLQVLANLGTAAGCAALYRQFPNPRIFLAMAASLAEPAADTVASEIGQALGGAPRLITSWQKVPPGTNGAITATGTAAGAAAAAAVALVFWAWGEAGWFSFLVIVFSAIAAMIADSVLGATLEGPRGLGNNAVNFISTVAAAIFAFLIAR
ncbi:MAG: DUF92 domain-containing protein, partial [Acidobacteria bacterium]|nr:DUF92 domain-containing protein [Acidobacteriota bacterium]